MLVERAFGKIVGRRLVEHQEACGLSDDTTARLGRVSQSYWYRVRSGHASVGVRLISGLAVSMPDLLRASIDEIQALKAAEVERLKASGQVTGDVRPVPAGALG